MRIVLFSALCSLCVPTQAFVPLSSTTTGLRSIEANDASGGRETVLYAQPKQQEKVLREELAERTSMVEDEEKYALRDGPGVLPQEDVEDEQETSIPKDETEGEKVRRKIEKLTKRRAYPLFLAEKGIEIVESIFPPDNTPPAKKEKIVVLGTGWGSVSFLKTVDTALYDITVISPRNYFLFTPMLGTPSAQLSVQSSFQTQQLNPNLLLVKM